MEQNQQKKMKKKIMTETQKSQNFYKKPVQTNSNLIYSRLSFY